MKIDTGYVPRNTRRKQNKVRNQWKRDWTDDRWWDSTPNQRRRVTAYY